MRLRLALLAASSALLVAACGGGGSGPAEAVSTSPPPSETQAPIETQTPAETQAPAETEAPVETQSPATDAAAAAGAAEVAALAESWYAEADPAVCDRMTATFVKLLWKAEGAEGLKACRAAIASADPVEDVVVADVFVADLTARARVVYTLDGIRRSDSLAFVKQDGEWLIDQITGTGAEEAQA